MSNNYSLSLRIKHYEDVIDEIGFTKSQFHLLIIQGFAIACDWIEILLLIFVQKCLLENRKSIQDYRFLINISLFSGEIIGTTFLNLLTFGYGRSKCIFIGRIIALCFGIATILSYNVHNIIICRFIVGFGIGFSKSPLRALIAEWFSMKYRPNITYVHIFLIIGELYYIASAYFILDLYGWHTLAMIVLLPSILLLFYCYLYIEESPLWYLCKGENFVAKNLIVAYAIDNEFELNDFLFKSNFNAVYADKNLNYFSSIKALPFSKYLWVTCFTTYFARYYCLLLIIKYYTDENTNCGLNYPELFFSSSVQLIGLLSSVNMMQTTGRWYTI